MKNKLFILLSFWIVLTVTSPLSAMMKPGEKNSSERERERQNSHENGFSDSGEHNTIEEHTEANRIAADRSYEIGNNNSEIVALRDTTTFSIQEKIHLDNSEKISSCQEKTFLDNIYSMNETNLDPNYLQPMVEKFSGKTFDVEPKKIGDFNGVFVEHIPDQNHLSPPFFPRDGTPNKNGPIINLVSINKASETQSKVSIKPVTLQTRLQIMASLDFEKIINAAKEVAIDTKRAIIEANEAAKAAFIADLHSRIKDLPKQSQAVQAWERAKKATLTALSLSENSIRTAGSIISTSQALVSIDPSYGAKTILQAAHYYEKSARHTADDINQAKVKFTHYSFLSSPYIDPLKRINKDHLINSSIDLEDASVDYINKDMLPDISLEEIKCKQELVMKALEKAYVTVEYLAKINGFITKAKNTSEGHNSYYEWLTDSKIEYYCTNDIIEAAIEKAETLLKEQNKVNLCDPCYHAALERASIRIEKAINTAQTVSKEINDTLEALYNFVKINNPLENRNVDAIVNELRSNTDTYQKELDAYQQ